MQNVSQNEVYDVIVIGSGAAGLSAALYAGRYLMNTLVIAGKDFGGATAKAGEIWNYPGYEGNDTYNLMMAMKRQAEAVGAKIVKTEAIKLSKPEGLFQVETAKMNGEPAETYSGKTIVLATGAERRKLGLPREEEFLGKGVHYCLTCDGPVYSGKTVAVVGGGDASVKGVLLAAQYASKIYLITRQDVLRAEPINQKLIEKLGDKLEIIYKNGVEELRGEGLLEHVLLKDEYKGSRELKVDGLFIEIGAVPAVGLAKMVDVSCDEKGYINVNNMMETNITGFYAAGDTVNHFGSFKQTITSAAMGTVAATSAYGYLKKQV